MKSNEYLNQVLNELFLYFDNSSIIYEYCPEFETHLVEIEPYNIQNDISFAEYFLELSDKFEELYPEETIILVNEESINKIENPSLVLSPEIFKFSLHSNEYVVLSAIDYNYFKSVPEFEKAGENNYALAA